MEPGDLIWWEHQLWLVRKLELGAAVLESSERDVRVLDSDADTRGECSVWGRPARDWPSAGLPMRRGRLLGVRCGSRELARFLQWVKLDDFQIGGALYLHPGLSLKFGDRLTAVYESISVPIEIPRTFSPLPSKRPLGQPLVSDDALPTLFTLLKRRGQ